MTWSWPPEECGSVTRETVGRCARELAAASKRTPRTRAYQPPVRNELKGLSVLLSAADQNPNGGIKTCLII